MDVTLTQLRYTLREAAALLRIHPNTLCLEIKRGHIRATRLGNRVFIHCEELDRYARGESTPPRMRRTA